MGKKEKKDKADTNDDAGKKDRADTKDNAGKKDKADTKDDAGKKDKDGKKIKDGKKVTVEEFVVSGESAVPKVKELVKEGMVRRIVLQNDKGENLIEIPLALGVAGAFAGVVMAPVIAAVGAVAAMTNKLKIVVEREDPSEADEKSK